MTYDPTAAYRSTQVTTSSPAAQVVLLYEGAIRFAGQSVQRLDAGDLEGAHLASVRAQAIVSALRESLDMSTGDIATRLDALYEFMHRQLVAGNVAKDPAPAREVIGLLRELGTAWRAIVAGPGAAQPVASAIPILRPVARGVPAYRTGVSGAA